MLHLNRVTSLSSVNLMTSQNLGVVFGRERNTVCEKHTWLIDSDPDEELGPQPRVRGYGRQGAVCSMDGGECAGGVQGAARLSGRGFAGRCESVRQKEEDREKIGASSMMMDKCEGRSRQEEAISMIIPLATPHSIFA